MMQNENENNRDQYGEGRNYGNDPVEGLYAYRPQQGQYKSRRISIRTILLIVVLAMAAVIWYAYPRGADRFEDIELPLVRADNQPYKILPANRGGMDIPHQDSTIFSTLDDSDQNDVETLLPEPEQPMDRSQINVINPGAESLVQAPDMNLDVKLGEEGKKIQDRAKLIRVPDGTPSGETLTLFEEEAADNTKARVLVVPENTPEPDVEQMPEPQPEPEIVEVEPVKVEKPVVKPAVVEAAPKPAPVETTAVLEPATTPKTFMADGVHYVQLGAFRSQQAAKTEYGWKQDKYGDVIEGYPVHYKYADLGEKGIYYRLQIGPMPESEAKSVCSRILEITPGGCLVTK